MTRPLKPSWDARRMRRVGSSHRRWKLVRTNKNRVVGRSWCTIKSLSLLSHFSISFYNISLAFNSIHIAAICVSATGAPSCFVMETEAVMFFTGPINEDQAVFEAYSALQKSMSNDTYVGLVPTVVLVEYLSPSPLPVPPGGETGGGSPIPVESERSTGANPWTIGASAAAVMGGFVSVLVWARARRTRQRRQQLQEETFHSNAQGADGSFPNAQQV